MTSFQPLQPKEPNKAEIQKILKQNLLILFNQVKKGCSRKYCYNILCANNSLCKKSKLLFLILLLYRIQITIGSTNIQGFNTIK